MSIGFKDPDAAFPRQEYVGEPTNNKAAREEWEPKIALPDGVAGGELIKTDWEPKYPHNKVEETSSGHRIEHDDTPGGERLSYVHKDGSGLEMYPNADGEATVLLNSVGKMVHLVGDDFVMIVNGNGEVTYKGNLNINVEGDFNISCNNYTVTTKGKQVEEVEQEKVENFVGDRVVTTRGNKSEVVLGDYTLASMGNSHFISKEDTKIIAEGDVDVHSGKNMTLTAKETMTSSALANRLVGMCLSVLGARGTFGGENVVMYSKSVHSETVDATTVRGDFIGNLDGDITGHSATTDIAAGVLDATPIAGSVGSVPSVTNESSTITSIPTEEKLTEGQAETLNMGIRAPTVLDENIRNSVSGELTTDGATNAESGAETFDDGELPAEDVSSDRSGVGEFDPNAPATERYNNPGGMYPSEWQNKYGAIQNTDIIGGGHSIAGFETKEGGAAAQMALLKEGKYYRNESISSAISTWSGGNHVDSYLSSLRNQGIDTTKNVSDYTSTKAGTIALARAMSTHEKGGTYSMSDSQWSNAYDLGESKGWM